MSTPNFPGWISPRRIRLPSGHSVTLGEYVRSWKALQTLAPDRLVERWSHFATPAGEILRAISFGVHDRINRRLPWYGQGRKWDSQWQLETYRAAQQLNHPRLVIRWLPVWLKARFAHRLRENGS